MKSFQVVSKFQNSHLNQLTHDVDARDDFVKFLVSFDLEIDEAENFVAKSVVFVVENHHENAGAENHFEEVQHRVSDAFVQQILAENLQNHIANSRNFSVVCFEKVEERSRRMFDERLGELSNGTGKSDQKSLGVFGESQHAAEERECVVRKQPQNLDTVSGENLEQLRVSLNVRNFRLVINETVEKFSGHAASSVDFLDALLSETGQNVVHDIRFESFRRAVDEKLVENGH